MDTAQKKLIAFIVGLIALITGIVIFTKPLENPATETTENENRIENTSN